jgi:hypothetical protein
MLAPKIQWGVLPDNIVLVFNFKTPSGPEKKNE